MDDTTFHVSADKLDRFTGNYARPDGTLQLTASPKPDNTGVHRWAGAANTFFWIDPEAEFIGMLWTQISPFAVYDIEREFQTLVYEALQ